MRTVDFTATENPRAATKNGNHRTLQQDRGEKGQGEGRGGGEEGGAGRETERGATNQGTSTQDQGQKL